MKTLIAIIVIVSMLATEAYAGCRTRTVTRGCVPIQVVPTQPAPSFGGGGIGGGDLSLLAILQFLRDNERPEPQREQVLQTLVPILLEIAQDTAKAEQGIVTLGQGQHSIIQGHRILQQGQQHIIDSLNQGQQTLIQSIHQGQQGIHQAIQQGNIGTIQGQQSILNGLQILQQGAAAMSSGGGSSPQILLMPNGASQTAHRVAGTNKIVVPSHYVSHVEHYATLKKEKDSFRIVGWRPEILRDFASAVYSPKKAKLVPVKPVPLKAVVPQQAIMMRYTGGSLTRYPKKLW